MLMVVFVTMFIVSNRKLLSRWIDKFPTGGMRNDFPKPFKEKL